VGVAYFTYPAISLRRTLYLCMEHLTLADILFRLVAAFGAGFVIGWERECHGRPAGLRTNIIACVAAASAMITSEIVFVQSANATPSGSVRADPARLAAGVLTGIGFLGAGTILRHENVVRGVTTAATLWMVTILGLAFGSGLFLLGLIGSAIGLFTLFILPGFEGQVQSDWYSTLSVTLGLDGLAEEELKRRIESFGPRVSRTKLSYDFEKRARTITLDLKLKRNQAFECSRNIVKDLALCPGVLKVEWV